MRGFQRDVTCGHCKRDTHIVFQPFENGVRMQLISADGKDATITGLGQHDPARGKFETAWGMCTLCAKPTLLCFHVANDGASLQHSETQQFPQPPKIEAPESWPEKLQEAWSDVQLARRSNMSAAGILTASRTCMQFALRALGAEGKNIFEEIEGLRTANRITQSMADWSHELRRLGASGTHDFEGSIEDAEELITFLEIFLYVTFTMEAKIAHRRAAK